jgi:hypothetical protein
MTISSRADLKDFALSMLGHPLVTVDITDEAMDFRIDNALEFFQEYYFDGADRFFLKHEVTQLDIDNEYITIPANIWGINNVLPFSNSASATPNIFDLQYQLRMNDLRDLTSTSMIYYSQIMGHIALIDQMLTVQRQFRFNRNSDKLYLDMNWQARVQVGAWLMIDCYAVLDPDINIKFWNNRAFKDYVVALFKLQWSMAYKKYDQIQLPGGVTIDGNNLYQEAKGEVDDIENDIKNNQSPLGFIMG